MTQGKEVGKLSKKLLGVKDSWYATARIIEGIVNHAGDSEALKKSLSDVSDGIRGFAEGIQDIGKVSEQLIPGLWKELKPQETEMLGGLERFYETVGKDLSAIEQMERMVPKLKAIRKRHESKGKRLRELENLGGEIEGEYRELSESYEKELSKVNADAEGAIKETRKRFLKEVGSLFEGFEIRDKKEGKRLSMEELFNRLAKEPGYYRGVDVSSKGIGGIVGKSSDREVRLLFLEYKSRDIAKAVAPVVKERNARLSALEAQGKRVEELKHAMGEVKFEKERVLKALHELESEMKELEEGGSEIERRFSVLDQVVGMRDAYLKTFNELNGQRKTLYEAIENAAEGYVPLEKDVEKRELKEELKKLKEERNALKGELKTLEKEKERVEKEHAEAGARIESLEGENEKLKAKHEEIAGKYGEAEKEIAAKEKELKAQQKAFAQLEKKYGQAEVELNELHDQIDALVSIRRRRPLQDGTRGKTEEEEEIGKKIGALREGREEE